MRGGECETCMKGESEGEVDIKRWREGRGGSGVKESGGVEEEGRGRKGM